MRSLSISGREFYFNRAVPANLETVVHGFSGGESVRSEAGGRIVHFQFMDGLSGLVFDAGVNPVALAATDGQQKNASSGSTKSILKRFQLLPSFPLAFTDTSLAVFSS